MKYNKKSINVHSSVNIRIFLKNEKWVYKEKESDLLWKYSKFLTASNTQCIHLNDVGS